MRLARLDLIRYGRFTDASYELPQGERDLHIVFGLNESGKTTSLTAIEDLLFGIPDRSPYKFLHDYKTMRIGAMLENGADRLEFRRRKGKRDTILGPDGLPMAGGEGLLGPFLGGADRAFFDRMFNLGHDRLAEGGRAIIAAKDDVGQMLFSTGTGLSDLRERLSQLEDEADGLWGSHRSGQRRYHQAEARFNNATKRLREHSLSVNDWRTARKALDNTGKAYEESRQQHEATSIELKRLARIRRVHASVRRKGELEQEIAALGDLVVLPENAAALLDEAEVHEAEMRAQVEILAPQLDQARQRLEGLEFDEVLVQRADDITQLHEQRINIRRGKDHLPKRRAELEYELGELARLATELGWEAAEPAELVDRIPARSKVARLHALGVQRGELATVVQAASKAAEEAQTSLHEKTERLGEMGEALDVSRLAAVLNAVRDSGDVASRIRSAQGQVQEASEQIGRVVKSLRPPLPDDTDIEALPIPPRATVQEHRDLVRNWTQRQREAKQRLADSRNALERDQKAMERRIRDEGVVAPAALEEARARRDDLWKLVKLQYVEGSPIPPEEEQAYVAELEYLPSAFEGAVREADTVADRRFDKAEDAGGLAELDRSMAEQKTFIAQQVAQEVALKDEGNQFDQVWLTLWADIPIKVLEPEAMLVWLGTRADILAAIGRQREARRQLDTCRDEEREASAQVVAEVAALDVGTDKMKTDSLRVVIEWAEVFQREQEAKAERLVEMRETIQGARADVTRRQHELQQAQAALKVWRKEWSTAVAEVGLQVEAAPEVVDAQISMIEQMRDHSGAAKQLRDKRIVTIERDIEEFDHSVAEVVAELAPDLSDTDAEDAVLELERRRDEAVGLRKQNKELSEIVVSRQEQIEALEEGRRKAWALVQPLKEAACVKEVKDLKSAIEQSDRLRVRKQELASVLETLDQQGDGLAMDILEEECRGVDIDQVRTREEEAESALKFLQEQLHEAVVAQTEARRVFQAIGGDDAAAKAAADRQEALAAMRDAAERYVRVRTSGVLLRWAIDRYRREKQGPLLKRAGELFRVLTLNSFERLEVAFDERENMYLTGVRPSGEVVAVPGLSTGTEDQLFLALRIAAVEDYLDSAVALPFVADDLFINFDPPRSIAGFEVLGQLAERTQVLFYTHHPHLVDVARKTLGTEIDVVSLDEVA